MQGKIAQFVPAALNIDQFQGSDPAGQRFLAAIGKLPSWTGPDTPPGPRPHPQGMFICTPDGELLGWITSAGIADDGKQSAWDVDNIQELMKRALVKWGKPDVFEPQQALKEEPAMTGEKNYLASFFADSPVVLRFVSRDLPRPKDRIDKKTKWSDDYFRRAWNLNYAGLTHEDVGRFFPSELTPGSKAEVPADLVRRLATDYLIDNTHGTAPTFGDEDVKEAWVITEVVSVKDGQATARLDGKTHITNGPFGFDAKIQGRAVLSLSERRLISFELVAVGSRWGAVSHSGRGPWNETPEDVGPAPMGLVAVLVDESPARK